MKIKISKDNLVTGIQTVQNIVSSKITLPILSNILIETSRKNLLKLNTTDLDLGISCEIPVSILEEGGITIPAKRFGDIIKELPNGDILIDSKKNNQVDIEGINCRFKLMGLPKEEFPSFPEFKDIEAIQFDQEIFKEMLRLTAFCVSHEESRYVLNGILMEISEDILRLVATDGRRLAKIEKKILTPIKENISVIIPLKTIQEINRNLKDCGVVTFLPGLRQVLFDIDGVLIATRIIEGEFPNYNQVIPKAFTHKIKVKTKEFLAALRRANLLATQDFQAIKFEIFANKIIISKATPNIGESREELSIEYGGPEFVVGFNPVFFIDILKNIDLEMVDLEISGAEKPCVIRLEDYLYLALPMKL